MLNGQPGRGGVTRGRADAPMLWGAETPGSTDQFAPEALTPAELMDLEHSTIMGIGAAAPQANPQAEGAGLQSVEGASAKSAWRRRLAPKHRQAVKEFFAPKDSGNNK